MESSQLLNRRGFIAAAGAGAGALALGGVAPRGVRSAGAPAKDPYRGLKVGVASYSLRKFSLEQAIEMTKQCGVKHITLKSMHLEYDTTREQRKAALKKVRDAGLKMMGGGVISLKADEKQVRSMFEYARDAGMPVIVASPALEALPIAEKMVKEFDIKIAIHNHGPGDTKYPTPMDAYRHVQDMDPRMGLCIDVGHTARVGADEVEQIYKTKDRLHDVHIKDVTARSKKGRGTVMGLGVLDIPGMVKALLDMRFKGHVALEYEENADDPLMGMIESFAYLRGVLAGMK